MKFERFIVNSSVESKEARLLAQEWKSASPATRKATCKRLGESFIIHIIGTSSTFKFCADGSVVTINQTRSYNSPAYKFPKFDVDESRKVIGFAKGRPIYA